MSPIFRQVQREIPDMQTGPLLLVAITPAMMAADQRGDLQELARLVDAKITGEWPPSDWEPHVFDFILKQYANEPQTLGWHRYVVLVERFGFKRTLVGAAGAFPKQFGDVEIGYSTLPEFQRRGYATAAARKIVEYLFTLETVRSVSAQTYRHLPESIKVMERCGLTYDGDGDERDTIRYRRRR